MYIIKQIPEDFVVEELIDLELDEKGEYSVYLLKKKNYSTERAIERVCQRLNVPRRAVHYCGAKDKKAVTTQYITVRNKRVDKVEIDGDLALEYIGQRLNQLSLGSHRGNKFRIVVRNIDKLPEMRKEFVNYFGEQRFSLNNDEIGKKILLRDFKGAVELLLTGKGDFEGRVREYLEANKNDYVGALRNVPKKILIMFVHAYQSMLWNKAVAQYVDTKIEGKQLDALRGKEFPVFGFGTDIEDEEIARIYDAILKEEGISERSFILREMPEISCEGDERRIVGEIKGLNISELSEDELNKGMKKCVLEFELGKGEYATEAVRQMFSQPR